jgi:hypothetical protein
MIKKLTKRYLRLIRDPGYGKCPEVIHMVRVLALLVSVSLFGLVGCGGGNSAASQCDNFVVNHYCPAIASCGYATQSACVSAVEAQLDCAAVTRVVNLGPCESDVDTATCSYLYSGIPVSCYGVFYH